MIAAGRLDQNAGGGRYDRLVKQMGRATQLPVALAEAGQPAEAGTVYFVPPELSIEQDKDPKKDMKETCRRYREMMRKLIGD